MITNRHHASQKLLSFFGILFSASTLAAPNLSSYDLVFWDEFNTASTTVNPDKWSTAPLWGPFAESNSEEQYYVDINNIDQGFGYNPFNIANGKLTISAEPVATTQSAPNLPPASDPIWNANPEFQRNTDYDPSDRNYLSGIITSNERFDFTHGYIEVRAKIPSGKGLWSAFWLHTTKFVEDVPEIDIMENIGIPSTEVYQTLHYFDIKNNWTLISSPTYKTTGPDFSQDFHTYGVAWEPKQITWYVDGEAVRTVTNDDYVIPKQSMYIIANLATGGTWAKSPNAATSFPAKFEIDYIRAYQKSPLPLITPATLASEYDIMFEDDFDPISPQVDIFGTGIDPAKWKTQYLWGPYLRINNENQIYIDRHGRHPQHSPSPFQVTTDANGSSILKIRANTVTPANLPVQPPLSDPEWMLYPENTFNPDYLSAGGWTPLATSGLLTSYDSFKFVNGYVEIRAKVPAGDGLWPALWLLNGYYVGPQPEIDIMEMKGEEPDRIHHSYHYYNEIGELVSSAEVTQLANGNYSDDYHTYGVQWDRGRIQWYIDNQITRTLEIPEVSTQLMYIIMNLAVGGGFVNFPGTSDLPATFDIDYVRAYQRKSTLPALPEKRIGYGMTVKGNIAQFNDVDIYAFEAAAGQLFQFDIDISRDNFDSVLRVFDDSGTQLKKNNNGTGPAPEYSDEESFLSWTSPASGTYYLGVSSQNNTAYELNDSTTYVSGMSRGQYELIVSPTVSLPNPGAATNDKMGYAVSIDGDYAVVGSYLADSGGLQDSGAVLLYEHNGDGTWSWLKTLTSGAPDANGFFGRSVSISGDTILVGERTRSTTGARAGSVWVFRQDSGGTNNWGLLSNTPIVASDTQDRDYFGRAVAISGSLAVIGAPNADPNGASSGSAYVIDVDTGAQVKLQPSDNAAGDKFGNAVAISGNRIVVGAFQHDNAFSNSGAAYVFSRNTGGANNWGQQKKLVSSNPQKSAQFGFSVDTDGATTAVGARLSDTGALAQSGSVYVFEKNSGGTNNWGETDYIVSTDINAGDRLGSSVAVQGDRLLIGAPQRSEFGDKAGKIYLFTKLGSNWSETAQLYNDEVEFRDQFGIAVAIDDFHGLAGSWLKNQPGATNAGAAYLFGL